MISKVITVGNRIELREKNIKDDKKPNTYVSQLYDIDDDSDILKIAMPIKDGRLVPLPVGARYEAFFTTKTGFYNCDVKIVDRFKFNNLFVMAVEILTDLQRYQRRQFYRLDITKDFLVYDISDEVYETYVSEGTQISVEGLESSRATTLDISGGGIRYVSKHKAEKGNKVLVEINLEVSQKIKKFMIPGEILSSGHMNNRKDTFEQRIQFAKLSKEQQEDIIKFVFEEERRRMKKERG